MRHAYLIIAHNEFEVLRYLLDALDDSRNDVFIHFDKKVKNYPELYMKSARLFVLENRVDVRWGNVSQIESEYALFEAACKEGPHNYYHLISGVHMPLYSQDYVHKFFSLLEGKDLLMRMPTSSGEIALKIQKYNMFTRNYISSVTFKQKVNQLLWRVCIRFQKLVGIIIYKNELFYKSANWLSLSEESLKYILTHKGGILKKYKYSFCGDEFFVPSTLQNSSLKDNIFYYDNLLKCDFEGVNPKIYNQTDYKEIIDSGCLFARKFSNRDIAVVENILKHINSKPK